jgi:hypothetical protein
MTNGGSGSTGWLDLNTLKVLTRHGGNVVAATAIFWIIGFCIGLSINDKATRDFLDVVENYVIKGLFLWLVYQMALVLWNRRVRYGQVDCLSVA